MVKIIALGILTFVVAFVALSVISGLLRAQDDLAVLLAVGFGVVAILGATFGLERLWRHYTKVGVLILFAVLGTGCTYIPPGYAGIVVNNYGSQRGVQDFPIKTGRVNYNPWSEDILQYPTYMQSGEWSSYIQPQTSITCNDKDGLPVGFNLAFGYQIDPSKIPAFYVKYRTEDVKTFSNGFLRNEAQGAFNITCPRYSAEQLFGSAKEELLNTVRDTVNAKMLPEGVVLQQFSTIGEVILPPQIKGSIERKMQATQRAQEVENQLRESEAQAKKRVADARGEAEAAIEKARGQSEANRLITQSLTTQLLEWRRLTIQEAATNRWNGGLPTTMLGDAIPMIQIPK